MEALVPACVAERTACCAGGDELSELMPVLVAANVHLDDEMVAHLEAEISDTEPALAELGFDSAGLPSEHDEAHDAVLEAFAEQFALVKTVRNEDWAALLHHLEGPRFRTPTSMPPPGGKGMKLFGCPSRTCTGLIWDRRQMDHSDTYIWPSGYFAKSEHNVGANGKLLNGRDKALVSFDDIMQANRTMSYYCHLSNQLVASQVLPFNEVLMHANGGQGLVGILVRSTRVAHLLWAMGIRALLWRTLPVLGELPLFILDEVHDVRPFGRAAQRALLHQFLYSRRRPIGSLGLPCLPIDTEQLDLDIVEALEFHGAFGITEESLKALVATVVGTRDELRRGGTVVSMVSNDDGIPVQRTRTRPSIANKARAALALGLRAAVEADNVASAIALVQRIAPLVFMSSGYDCAMKTSSAFGAYLHRLAEQSHAAGVRVAVGAALALHEFASGRMMPRIMEACKTLEDWLQGSKSLRFRLRSWSDLQANHTPGQSPELTAFMTHKAEENRKHFYQGLLNLNLLEERRDLVQGMRQLQELVSELHHPCLRLELLQYVLGVGESYDLDVMSSIAGFALRVISTSALDDADLNVTGPGALIPDSGAFFPNDMKIAACHLQGLEDTLQFGGEFGGVGETAVAASVM